MTLDNIANILRGAGLKVVETPGWITRGFAAQDLIEVRGVLWHHTATNRAAFDRDNCPTLNMLINGRSDLPGPLCNLALGRDGTVYVVATGVANHAGSGVLGNIPRDMGNHYLIGIEMESSGVQPWDWTPEQLEVAPKLGAALERGYLQGFPPELRIQAAHYEYSDAGKIDPSGWPGAMDGLRASINHILAAPVATKPTPAKPQATHIKPIPRPSVKPSAGYVPDLHWVVTANDTLSEVAAWAKTGVPILQKYNGIRNANKITVGEWIWPPTGLGTWTIEHGDTLSSIVEWCQKNWSPQVTMAKVQSANGINNPNVLPPVGRRLQIPR